MVGTEWIGTPAVGTGAVAQRHNIHGAFRASATEYTPLPLTALACPSARSCVAVGGDTVARIALNRTSPPTAPTTPGPSTTSSSTAVKHLPTLIGRR
jgi:hypothetical protein